MLPSVLPVGPSPRPHLRPTRDEKNESRSKHNDYFTHDPLHQRSIRKLEGHTHSAVRHRRVTDDPQPGFNTLLLACVGGACHCALMGKQWGDWRFQ